MVKINYTLNVSRLIIFCLLALFMACHTNDPVQDEVIPEQHQEQSEGPFQITTVRTEDIPRVTKFLNYKAQKDIFAKDKISGAIFEHENVKKAIDTLGQESYSFRFTYPGRPDNVFYNLMVGVNPDGTSKTPYVIKYVCDEDQFASFKENNYSFLYFKGSINLHSFNDFFQDSDFAKDCTGSNGDPVECSQIVLIGSATDPTNLAGQGFEGGGVTHTPNGLGGYDITVTWYHTIEDGRTYQYNGGECPQSKLGKKCGVSVSITGGKKQQKRTGSDCADCGLPTVIQGIANLGVSIGLSTSQITWLQKAENINLAGQIKYYFSLAGNANMARTHIDRIVDAGMDKTLVAAFPFVKYPEGKAHEYSTKYPRLTQFLKEELPKIQFNEAVINSISGNTGAPKETIREALQWGKGPEIIVEQLGGVGKFEKYGVYRGHIFPEDLNKLFLDIDLVEDLENLENSQEFTEAMAYLVAVTILHEYNHFGDTVFGDSELGWKFLSSWADEDEAGTIFEKEIFGKKVWRSNVGVILRTFKLY